MAVHNADSWWHKQNAFYKEFLTFGIDNAPHFLFELHFLQVELLSLIEKESKISMF